MHRASTSLRPTAEQAEAVAALEVASIAAANEAARDVNLYSTFNFVSRISTVNLNMYIVFTSIWRCIIILLKRRFPL